MDDSDLDPLAQLLCAVNECGETEKQIKNKPITELNEDEFFLSKIAAHDLNALKIPKQNIILKHDSQNLEQESQKSEIKKSKKGNLSLIHNGDTDSSDDEDNKDYQNSKYNEYGCEIKHLLTDQTPKSVLSNDAVSLWKKQRIANPKTLSEAITPLSAVKKEDVMTEPFFGIRISKPLISNTVLQERMNGRVAVPMARVKNFVATIADNQDWVIAGAIVTKSNVKTSQNGSQYIIWTLSDLQHELQTVNMFLFRSAYKNLWKTAIGTVVGVLNPAVLENRDGSRQQATLSVDNNQKVMIFGQSKDYGLCKSKKKSGEQCTNFVNSNRCTYCIYHVKQEYQKCSLRSDLQSKFSGGGLTALRNKVLGKNEVFYAGKSYTAIPAKKNKKITQRDNNTLRMLNNEGILTATVAPTKKKKGVAASFDATRAQRLKDLQMLQKLNSSSDISFGLDSKTEFNKEAVSAEVSLDESKKTALDIISKLKCKTVDNKIDKNEISGNASLQDSKKTALGVIAKLKAKKSSKSNNSENRNSSENNSEKEPPNKTIRTTRDDPKLTELNKDAHKEPSASKINSTYKISNHEKEIIEAYKEVNTEFVLRDLKPKPDLTHNGTFIIDFNKPLHKKPDNAKSTIEKNSKEKTMKTPNCKQKITHNDDLTIDLIKTLDKQDRAKSAVDKLCKNIVKSPSNKPKLTKLNNDTLIEPSASKIIKASEVTTPKLNEKENKTGTETQNSKNGFVLFPNAKPKPKLTHNGDFIIDLNKPINKKVAKAKLTALQWVEQNGPINKENPTGSKKSGVKRFLENQAENEPEAKKSKIKEQARVSQRFRKIMELTSKHVDLLEQRDNEEQEKYFSKLETREKLEEKMMSTYKIQCKAVKCLQCKYTNFSAADRCKDERHPLKVFDAIKRFFKCGNCGNRTVSLEICPLFSCKHCGGSKWERTSMMMEKKVHVGEALSIRGGEQTFINSVISNANINLLMPDD